MSPNRRLVLPLLAALALAVLVTGVSACGYSSDSKDVVEGEPMVLGDLQFNVTFSRYLNPNDNEQPQTLPSTLTITDAAQRTYHVIPSESLYALQFGGEVEPQEQVPVLDSTPQQGPIEGSVAIFLLPSAASDNRPLTLHIPAANGEKGEVTLDL